MGLKEAGAVKAPSPVNGTSGAPLLAGGDMLLSIMKPSVTPEIMVSEQLEASTPASATPVAPTDSVMTEFPAGAEEEQLQPAISQVKKTKVSIKKSALARVQLLLNMMEEQAKAEGTNANAGREESAFNSYPCAPDPVGRAMHARTILFVSILNEFHVILVFQEGDRVMTEVYECDGCQRPITNERFKCTSVTCPDFDLCRECKDSGVWVIGRT